MIKIKALKPSLREKKRYIVYSVESDSKVDMFKVQNALVEKVTEMLGVFTPSGIMSIKFDNKVKKGIIRVNHTAVDLVRSCFVLINKLNNVQVSIHTVGVSGILKKAKEYV